MHVWGLQCNHHLVMKTAKLPEGMKHIIDSPWRSKSSAAGGRRRGSQVAPPQLRDLKMLNVLPVVSF